MKILVVEDDSVSALVLRKALEKLGHDVTVVSDGEAAWQTLVSAPNRPGIPPFRVVISDWMMPVRDGLDLCRGLRAHRDLGYLYFILLTARGGDEDRREALASGVDDFLVKPLDTGELLARLEVAKRMLTLMDDVSAQSSQLKKLQHQNGSSLGEVLVQQGALNEDQLRHALDQQERTGQAISAILIANGLANEEQVTQALAAQIDMPYVAVANALVDPCALAVLERESALLHRMLPLADPVGAPAGGPLRVAVADPWNIDGVDLLQRLSRRRVEPMLASESALLAAIERAYQGAGSRAQEDLLSETLEGVEDSTAEGTFDLQATLQESEQAPAVRLLNVILSDAVRKRASDIHIEPYEREFDVRYRIDGELHVVRTLPRALLPALVSRVKVMGEMDIAEKRLPQDGRISTAIEGRRIDLRISTLPVQFGERVVFRLLDRSNVSLSLDQISFSERNRKLWEGMIHHPHGIVLVTGPTGSGKTTTLYATLNALKSSTTNICTCEDPIEYQLDRIGQSAVNEKTGLTFAMQLRALLRQDPDILLVGEIRDSETAEIAFRAALTGHLVFSTLHCNEASGAPTRLIEMGAPGFLISSALLGVLAQRLVRKLCPHCRRAYQPDADRIRLIEAMTGAPYAGGPLYEPVGCPECDGVGMRGRMGVHEILPMSDRLRALMMKNPDTATLRQLALSEGLRPLVVDGMEKAQQGLTTFEEVQRKLLAA